MTTEEVLLSDENKIHPDFYMTQLSDLLTVKDKVTVRA